MHADGVFIIVRATLGTRLVNCENRMARVIGGIGTSPIANRDAFNYNKRFPRLTENN